MMAFQHGVSLLYIRLYSIIHQTEPSEIELSFDTFFKHDISSSFNTFVVPCKTHMRISCIVPKLTKQLHGYMTTEESK